MVKRGLETKFLWPDTLPDASQQESLAGFHPLSAKTSEQWKACHSLYAGSPMPIPSSAVCRSCKVDRPITDGVNTDQKLTSDNEVSQEKIKKC